MTQNPLLEQILSGQNRQLQVLAASGLVPLPPEQLIPIQVGLTGSPDAEISANARQALQGLEPSIGANFLSSQAGEAELRYFAENVVHPVMVTAIIQRPTTPRPILATLAAKVPPDLQEVLVLRQDAIIDHPEILVQLEKNPQLSNYAKRRVWEYREHLLPRDKVPPKTEEEIAREAESVTEEEIREAIEEITGEPTREVDLHKLSDADIRQLPVPMRVKVARGASQQIRAVLIRDSNAQVALAVMNGNNLSDQEIEMIAASRNVCDEVLREIPKRREWIRKYTIVKSLVKNPRFDLATAIRFIPRLSVRDLREIAKDKNVADGVRSTAFRLYQAKR